MLFFRISKKMSIFAKFFTYSMQQGKDIELRRYADGTPSVLRKTSRYADLQLYLKRLPQERYNIQ